MKRPIYGDLLDQAFDEFKKSEWYTHGIKPLKDKIEYPDNYIRRIFDEGFAQGRVSKINHNLTSGELIKKQFNCKF